MNHKTLIGAAVSALVLGVGIAACDNGDDEVVQVNSGTVIQNVTVVNTRDGSLTGGAAVVIDGGKIRRIVGSNAVRVGGTAQSVDGSGKYVVPGFNDMHTHVLNSIGTPPGDFPMLLASGVTGVREAGGTPDWIKTVRQQNLDVAAGKVDAPEVLMVPSTIYAGQAPTDPLARQFVRDRKAEGADFVKAVGGPPAAFIAVMQEAKAQGFHAAGHLTPAVSALDSSKNGYHSFEHLGSGVGLVLDCATDEANIRNALVTAPPPAGPNVVNPRLYDGNFNQPRYQAVIDTYSDAKCQALAQTFVANDTWQAVTLIRLRTQDYGDDAAYRNDPNLRYVDKTRRALWESIAQQFAATVTPTTRATLQKYYALQLKVVKTMKQQGVKIMSGSDLGGGWVIPGIGLHQEFRELAAAGLTPLEVLQTTTLNSAQFVGREATMGTVEEGKNADLVLLDGNPIADVANLDEVSGVFLKGKYYSKAALAKIKSDVAATYEATPIKPFSAVIDTSHVD